MAHMLHPISYFRKKTYQYRAIPDFLIVGAQKSGTTSLYYDLSAHPQLKTNLGPQEVAFFTSKYNKGITHYRSFFPFHKKGYLYYQSCPYYLFHPLTPERVYYHFPNMKIIILLRNPIYRTFSHYNHQRLAGRENLSFEEALKREEERLEGEEERLMRNPDAKSYNHRHYSYIKRSIYIYQIDRWLNYFSKSQMLILSSDEYFQEPASALSKVYDFLGIPYIFPSWIRNNEVSSYKLWSNKITNIFNRHNLSKLGLTRKINYRPYKHSLTEDQKTRLFEYFIPFNEMLFNRIKKNFGWNDYSSLS